VSVASVANLKFSERANKPVKAGFARKVTSTSLSEKLFVAVEVPFLGHKNSTATVEVANVNKMR
jgi:hypothetical protein